MVAGAVGGVTMRCDGCGADAPDSVEYCAGCGADFSAPRVRKESRNTMARKKQQAVETPPDPTAKEAEPSSKAKRSSKEKTKAEVAEPSSEASPKAAKTLASLEAKIEKLRDEQQRVEWEIGSALKTIRQEDLWRATGAKSFGEYVQLRFGFTNQTAKDFMAIAECFSREQAAKVKPTHLRLLTRVPSDEERARLYSEVAKEPEITVRELADRVSATRKEAGLRTVRGGYEGTVLVNARLAVGPVATGKWTTAKARTSGSTKRVARFEIGSSSFLLEDLGDDGFVVRLLDLAAAEAKAS